MPEQFAVKYDKQKLAAMQKALADSRGALADAEPAFRRVAVYLDRWVQMNFRTQGGKVGGWPPFARGGRLKRGADGKFSLDTTAKLLQDTGALRLSYRPFAFRDNAGIGSDLPYSMLHNDGIGVPERRMLPKQAEVKDNVANILDDYVMDNVRRNVDEALR